MKGRCAGQPERHPGGAESAVRRTALPALAALAALVAGPAPAQQSGDVPAFPAGAEAISVDVVVLDRDGRPVAGLERDDFTLLEDGKPQAIAGFEARAPYASGDDDTGPRAFTDAGRVATNEGASRSAGRSIALVVDDLGLDPVEHAPEVRESIRRWIGERADPRDEVTLVTTSGDLWWSDVVARGREDLLAVVERIRGRKLVHPLEPLNEYEAYRIANYETRGPAPGEGVPTQPPSAFSLTATADAPAVSPTRAAVYVTERVMERWYRAGYCEPRPDDWRPPCRAKVEARAGEVYNEAARRARALLGAVERLSTGLAGWRGRKSIFVFSVGLVRDTLERSWDSAIAASRRGNTAVYFLDARGLRAPSLYTAETRSADLPGPEDVGSFYEEAYNLTAGTEYLARATGGATVRDTNDLVAGLERVVRESSAYYLLGYQPERLPDGSWRELEVRVSRPGALVRARPGYFATPPGDGERPEQEPRRARDGRDLPAELVAGGEREEIPLRLASYVLGPGPGGLARVLVALEVDTGALGFTGSGRERRAALELSLVGVSRRRQHVASLAEDLDVTLPAEAVGGWWSFARELHLPSGVAQVRALVADGEGGRAGTVTQRLEVPAVDGPFLSTPIVSDQLRVASRGTRPRLDPIAHRRFRPPGPLVCVYEVHGLAGRSPGGAPEAVGSFVLRHASRGVVSRGAPTPIEVAEDGRLVRAHSFGLDGLVEGPYELELRVEDRVSGRTLTAREPFLLVRE